MVHILVVEDDDGIRQIIVDVLEMASYTVAETTNGAEALAIVGSFKPDLIISDVNMPVMDGFELLLHLRTDSKTRSIPCIFLTAKVEKQDYRYGMSIGADDYLTKPFTAPELLSAVQARLQRFKNIRSEIDTQVANLQLLQQMDQELSERLEPEWLITMIFDWVLRQSDAAAAYLVLREHEHAIPKVRYLYGKTDDLPFQVGDMWQGDEALLDVLTQGEVALIEQSQNDNPDNAKSLLAVPIIFGEAPMGMIVLESERGNGIDEDLGTLLVQFANRASVALQHAQLFEQLRKQQEVEHNLRLLFRKFVSKDVATAIEQNTIVPGGTSAKVAILFCDIRDFTAYSENHDAQEVVDMLNTYIPIVVEAAHMHGGNVNKFGGDSVMIVFGVPNPVQNPAYQALLTALQIKRALPELNTRLFNERDFELVVGIGISTGNVIAGTIGSDDRQEYTVIGDAVNLAARIESLNKQYTEHTIFITDDTYQDLDRHKSEFTTVALGHVEIRGKAESVRIWAVDNHIHALM
ncbi:MAG: adenylate/guanylate cyclase domain-containing protein [Chloroflexota bacterium]